MAMIVDSLASQFTETLATMAKDEVSLLLGAKGALQQLEEDLRTIHINLEDAEQKAFTNPAIRAWLAKLKDLVYEADDIIDYSYTQAENLARQSSDPLVRCCSHLFSCFPKIALRHQMGSRIRGINERLERIKNNQSDFHLNPAAPRDDHSSGRLTQRQSDPLPELDIIGEGIKNDTRNIVNHLTMDYKGPLKIPVIAIVGMAGVGKTTLAQLVYNHDSVKDNFQMPPPVWVCVSKECNESDLLNIITASFGRNPEPDKPFADRLLLLARAIVGKKFFLVLDDVWSYHIWENLLRKPLERGAAGSRVLITTRDVRVANQIGAVYTHTVQPLSPKDSWSLLCKMVFLSEEEGMEIVGDAGIQVVKRCCGLPLAIKAIAGVLRTKPRRRSEWERVLQNRAWLVDDDPNNGVMGVFYLSYQDLPLRVKQCFIFCSLYPEDHVFMRHTLIQYWVAEGFVKEEGELIREEVARGYYHELLGRNLLQPDPRYYDDGGCKMHDVLRALALFLSRDENFVGDPRQLVSATAAAANSSLMKLRHLSVVDRELHAVPELMKMQTSLRTLLFMGISLNEGISEDLVKKLGCLRVLDLGGTNITKLPTSIGKLLHLRYLNLSFCAVVELPETIGNLSNLQYLILQGCKALHRLPRGIAKLYKLRSLDLLKTPVNGLPAGIGLLQDLNRLMGFIVNEDVGGGWCSLKELRSLTQLRTLTVGNLEKALIRGKPRGFLFRDNRHMRHLELYCTPNEADGLRHSDEQVQNIRVIFEEELFPPPSVEKLEIKGFFGLQFPSWMANRNAAMSLANVRRLDLEKCGRSKQLPPLGQLPNLDLLTIKGSAAVKTIGPEFMGVGSGVARVPRPPSSIFPRLETLRFRDMRRLVEWQWEAGDGTTTMMPCLQTLELTSCPRLRCLPEGLHHVSTLTTLIIQAADSLSVIENLVSLRSLILLQNPNLVRVSNLPALQSMSVDHCAALSNVEGLHSLKNLNLQDMLMVSLPEWLLLKEGAGQPSFPVLERLYVFPGGPVVLRRCLEGSPDWPKIQHIPQVFMQCMFGRESLIYNRDSHTFTVNLDADDASSGCSSVTTEEEICSCSSVTTDEET